MSDEGLIFLIGDCHEYIAIICCLMYFFYFSKFSSSQKIISYYLFFLLVLNYTMKLLGLEGVNNLANTHILVLGEFIFLSLYFRELLTGNFFFKKYFRFFLAGIGGLIIMNTLFLENINTFNTNAKVLVLFTVIFLATAFYYDRSKRLMEVDIHEKAARIISAALLLYYSGSFFVYLFYKFTLNNEVFYSNKMLLFNASLYLVFTILMLIATLIVIFHRKPVEEQ